MTNIYRPTVKQINDSILTDIEFLTKTARNDDIDMKKLKLLMDQIAILLMGISYE